jgi:hypothetical protein
MQICEVTGRVHRNPRELKAELIRLDTAMAAVGAILNQYAAIFSAWPTDRPRVLTVNVGDAWNAAHDAHDALKRERDEVAANPRPIPGYEAGTYRLAAQNID